MIPVRVAGSCARAIIDANSVGRVLAVFERSSYITFGEQVICLGSTTLGAGPLSLLFDWPSGWRWPAHGAGAGVSILRQGAMLYLEAGACFDLAHAAVWHAPVPARVACDKLQAGLDRLRTAVVGRGARGLGTLIDPLCQAGWAEPVTDTPWLQASYGPIGRLCSWLAHATAGFDEPPADVERLIGLGPGLTPSGDDFLCGCLVALNHCGRADLAARLALQVLPIASHATHIISWAHLRAAAEGEAGQVLFDVLDSIVQGGAADLEPRLDAITAIGHSSGWDTLAGAVAALSASFRRANEVGG